MPKSLYKIRYIERVTAYYLIEADCGMDALNHAHDKGQFIEYEEYIDTDKDSGVIIEVTPLS